VSLWTFSLKAKNATQVAGVRSTMPINAGFSPDGRWLAYTSIEAPGKDGLFVEPFPATGAKYLVTRGIHPVWSRDGREVMSQPQGGQWAVQAITTEPSFTFGSPMPLSRGGAVSTGPDGRRNHDMSADGRFLGVVATGQNIAAGFPQIQVVLNWFEELKVRVPTTR
jgi:hypothetical protein